MMIRAANDDGFLHNKSFLGRWLFVNIVELV